MKVEKADGASDHICPGQIDHYKWMIIITYFFEIALQCPASLREGARLTSHSEHNDCLYS